MKKSFNSKSGFTLLELLVSIGLFLIAVFMGLGTIASMYNANNKSESLVSVISNLNYSIEGMTRNIKYATTYHCDITTAPGIPLTSSNDCVAGGSNSIAITNSLGTIIYRYANSKIEISTDLGTTYKPVTGSDITISYARFYVGNSIAHDTSQPYILMVIRGYSGGKPSAQSSFDLQTWVSARALDI